ncbi:MAG TPA: hypothetical protein VI997_02685, partial [Candidatus Thermoplasmatota archaeon]|nr:hypothetical protein [Candidatus Thermoplasmatota archaeon]
YGSPRCIALGNTGDELDLVAPDGTTGDTVAWGSGGSDGLSLQRCIVDDAWTLAAPTLGSPNTVCAPPVPAP